MSIVGIAGGGAWGTALAHVMAETGHTTYQWARDVETVDEINQHQTNSRYLDDARISSNIRATNDIGTLAQCATILVVTPAQTLKVSLPLLAQVAPDATFVLCAKGIDQTTGLLPHQTAKQHLESNQIAALSGPSFAADVARGLPTAVTLAAHSKKMSEPLAQNLAGEKLRIYASDDLTGVEAGGALKNVMALAVGMAHGLGMGASAEAALIARGFAELTRIASALGGRAETMAGLSGLGDLVLTCSSSQSRNFAYGVALAKGHDMKNRKLAEGVATAKQALTLAQSHAIDAPICEAVSQVLNGDLSVSRAASTLLARPLRSET